MYFVRISRPCHTWVHHKARDKHARKAKQSPVWGAKGNELLVLSLHRDLGVPSSADSNSWARWPVDHHSTKDHAYDTWALKHREGLAIRSRLYTRCEANSTIKRVGDLPAQCNLNITYPKIFNPRMDATTRLASIILLPLRLVSTWRREEFKNLSRISYNTFLAAGKLYYNLKPMNQYNFAALPCSKDLV